MQLLTPQYRLIKVGLIKFVSRFSLLFLGHLPLLKAHEKYISLGYIAEFLNNPLLRCKADSRIKLMVPYSSGLMWPLSVSLAITGRQRGKGVLVKEQRRYEDSELRVEGENGKERKFVHLEVKIKNEKGGE